MKENKIISFNNYKRQLNSRNNMLNNNRTLNSTYKFVYTITIEIFKKGDKFSINYSYPNEISEDDFFEILYEVYLEAGRQSKKAVKLNLKELLNLHFKIMYFIDTKNNKNFKFICYPKMSNDKLAAILSVMFSII